MLLQLLQNSLSDPSMWGYIGAGSGIGATAGSILTMGVQKLMSKKKDDADVMEVIIRQVDQLLSQQEFKDKIIEQLQLKSCFREPCENRINGNVTTRKRKVNPASLTMKVGIVLALLLLSFSCKPLKEIIYIDKIKYVDRMVYDSISVYKHDSVMIYRNGDTVFISKVQFMFKDRIKYKTDSIYIANTQYNKITKTVEVERKLTMAQKTLIGLGKGFLLFLALFIFYLIIRFFPTWRKLLKI